MKQFYILFFLMVINLGTSHVFAQYPSVTPKIYGSSPFQDSLWGVDSTNFAVFQRMGPTLSGFTITGMTGLAYDPTTYQTFIIMKVSGIAGRVLGTIDLNTGVCTQIADLGDKFASIVFDKNGQLYGATGNGATVPESLYSIDKTTGAKTLLYSMGNGADGEILGYNRKEDMFYHWSGNGTVVLEKFPVSSVIYAPTNIPISGTSGGETFGSLYLDSTTFLISNINSNFLHLNVNGVYGGSVSNNPDDLRGLVMPPQFAISEDTLCAAVDTLFIGAGSLQEFDSLVYHWGDGTSTITGITGAFHTYSSPGNYTVQIELDNGVVRDTFPTSFAIHINNVPLVSLTGNTALCPGDTVTLSGSGGGASQWYFNGSPIAGATSSTYQAAVSGIYNMSKTNLNGCADSSHVSLILVDALNPVVNIGSDTTACASIVLDAGNTGATYLWSSSGTNQLETVFTSGQVAVTVTDTNGCIGADTVNVIIYPLPVVSVTTTDTSFCLDGSNSVLIGSPAGGVFSGSGVTANEFDPSIGVGIHNVYYSYTDVNACSATDTLSITVDDCAGIAENVPTVLSLFPNPNTGNVTIINPFETGSLQISDVFGNVVYQQMVISKGKVNLDLSGCAKGIYTVNVVSIEGKQVNCRISIVAN